MSEKNYINKVHDKQNILYYVQDLEAKGRLDILENKNVIEFADKLTTSRSITLEGVISGTTTFNGSQDVTINTSVSSLDASVLTGTIDIDRLPKGALERCIIVEDDDARLSLTINDAQIGDTVKVLSNNKMYFIKDDTKLDSEDGYEIYTAGSASNVPWSGITGKPESFPPETHSHSEYMTIESSTLEFKDINDKLNDKVDDSVLASIAKTGNINDLVQTEGDCLLIDCGTSIL